MRPRTDRAQAALLRAATAIVGNLADGEKPTIVVQELRARDWASITFTGARHELDLALAGAADACAAALARLQALLPEADIPLAGQVVADIGVTPGDDGFTITALVIDD